MDNEQLQIIRSVIDAWDNAIRADTGEAKYEAFCAAGEIEPLRRLLFKENTTTVSELFDKRMKGAQRNG